MDTQATLLDICITTEGRWWTVTMVGEMDCATAATVVGIADGLAGSDLDGLTFDLSGITFLDSAGYRSISQAVALLEAEGTRTRLVSSAAAASTVVRSARSSAAAPSAVA